ncbi:DUF6265 family protein [Pedobacter chitinilyticus]|uniref:DUF6265 domain-containing protein n=1 Tax=Pedobacter chitinilyticus TaxID=2233776 RepID=A0A451GDJ8_9SPHI|nr:DUF6265 family protein [Pedobacter chitinilyticus]RWU10955.1 hypothetical protein DPV69_06395 [Pedobacter chitinilyticus]
MKTRLFFVVIVIVVFCSWAMPIRDSIKKATWLIGTWENKTSRGSIYETWAKVNDKELFAKSYALKERDTMVFESVLLVEEKGGLFYIPIVTNQNGGQPVRFTLKTISDTTLIFENPQHDFPQIISYTKIDNDRLVAEISGVKNGQQRKQTFPMQRIR